MLPIARGEGFCDLIDDERSREQGQESKKRRGKTISDVCDLQPAIPADSDPGDAYHL